MIWYRYVIFYILAGSILNIISMLESNVITRNKQ